jgi:poly(3-hydroxybutyrate) depolymerase
MGWRAFASLSALALLVAAPQSRAQAVEAQRTVTLGDLFDVAETRELSRTLPADRAVTFRLRIPNGAGTCGVMVFVKPDDSGAFRGEWAPLFDEHRLMWISADGFGNDKPSAQRVLVAMMAVKLAARSVEIDPSRVYIGGMSGGGRVASQTITRFPQRFSGALYIVGADFHLPEEPLRARVISRRYVFITGSRDFNHREMRRVFERYQRAGASASKLLDLPRFGHEYPDAAALGDALDFLDSR